MKTIEEYPDYEINEDGFVRNKNSGEFLKLSVASYVLYKNRKRKYISRKKLLHKYFPEETNETYKTIEEYPNYEINEDGKIRNKTSGVFLKIDKGSYKIFKDDNRKTISRKKLLHMYFPKPIILISPDEIFVDIDETYKISNKGRIQNTETGDFLKPQLDTKGYYRVNLKGKDFNIHRLIAKLFIPNPLNLPEVDHIDRNPKNNSLENLRWCTRSENVINTLQLTKHFKNIHKYKNSWVIRINTARCQFYKSYPIKDFTLEQVKEIRNKIYEENSLPILD